MLTPLYIYEYYFLGRNNTIDVQMQDDTVVRGVLANSDFTNVTKVAAVIDDTIEYNSTDNGDKISFESSTGIVILSPKTIYTVPQTSIIEFVVYDPENPDGASWLPRVVLTVLKSKISA